MGMMDKILSLGRLVFPSRTKVTVNDVDVETTTITITRDSVICDSGTITINDMKQISIVVHGNVSTMELVKGHVTAQNVGRLSTVSGGATVNGDVSGDVSSVSGSINIGGTVGGDVETVSGNISCSV